MLESELKAAFAAFLLETPDQPLEAALKLFPAEKDRGEACRVAFAWINDPEVIIEIERLKKDGCVNKRIPTKEEVIEQLWELVKDARTSAKDRGLNARLIADMLNYIDKTGGVEESRRMPSAPIYKMVTE